jgi:hypothetical protein
MTCYYHKSVSQFGYRHLRHVTPPASTSAGTFPVSHELPKGTIFSILLVCY